MTTITAPEKVTQKKLKSLSSDLLQLYYVYLKTIEKWQRNARNHGLNKIIQSIRTHGFKDPLKWEPALNDGAGGIAEGNGRDDALLVMFSEDKTAPPRGIVYDPEADDWLVPVLFGVDAESLAAAEAYAVDHNNTTLAGAFTEDEIMRLWTADIAPVIVDSAAADHRPATITEEMAEVLTKIVDKGYTKNDPLELVSGDPDPGPGTDNPPILHQCPKCGHVSEIL